MSDNTTIHPDSPTPPVAVPSPTPTTAPPVTVPTPKPVPPAKAVATLPRYNHGLLGQSQVGSRMVEHADGEWIRREDVLKVL